MTKYKCTYGFTEKIIEASDEDEARDEFAYNFIENEDEIILLSNLYQVFHLSQNLL